MSIDEWSAAADAAWPTPQAPPPPRRAPYPRAPDGRESVPVAAAESTEGGADLLGSLAAHPWGQLSPSVYETGRLVTLTPWLVGHERRLEFLLASQRSDGGWGGPDGYGLVPTLSATEALVAVLRRASGDGRFGHRWAGRIAAAAHRGLALLAGWLDDHSRLSIPDTPAVEILVPALVGALNAHLAELRDLPADPPGVPAGLEHWRSGPRLGLPHGVDDALLLGIRRQVAAGLPLPDKILHSLEVAGAAARGAAAVRPVPPGTVGASPAATAAWLGDPPAARHPQALAYLEAAARAHGGPVSSVVPVTAFERSWVLDNLFGGGLTPRVPADLTNSLAASLGPHGTPGGAGLPADADTTSVAILTLARLGVRVGLEPLRRYERATHFVTWDGERTPSTTTNAHVLEAVGGLAGMNGPGSGDVRWHRSVMIKVAGWLHDQQQDDGTWPDKWHASPFYATAAAARALGRFGGEACGPAVARAVKWVLASQRADGSWGDWTGTAEETAYALHVLLRTPAAARSGAMRHTAAAARGGLAYLTRADGHDHPPLWHDKDLYTPRAVVESAVVGAVHLAQTYLAGNR